MRRLLAALLAALTLVGCASEVRPTPSPRPVEEVVPVLSSEQLDAIVTRIVTGLAAADEAKDPAQLAALLDGPALAMRTAAYTMMNKNPAIQAVTPIGVERLQDVVPARQDWPRSVLVVTRADKDDQVPELLVLTQRAPRDRYKLTAYVSMIGGATLPLTTPMREGVTLPRRADPTGLMVSPQSATSLYAQLLTQGPAMPDAAKFAPSPMTDAIFKAQDGDLNALAIACPNCFTVSITHTPTGPLWAFGTQDGGALVVSELSQVELMESQNSYQFTLGPEQQALAGIERVRVKGTFTRAEVFAFYIPPKGPKATVSVVGGTVMMVAGEGS